MPNAKLPNKSEIQLAADAVIAIGNMVMDQLDGYGDIAASAAGNRGIAGFALGARDNTGGQDGDLSVQVESGQVALLNATSVTQAMVGRVMYAVDEDTVDDVDTGDLPIAGIMVGYVSATQCWVYVDRVLNKLLSLSGRTEFRTATVADGVAFADVQFPAGLNGGPAVASLLGAADGTATSIENLVWQGAGVLRANFNAATTTGVTVAAIAGKLTQ